MVNVVHHPPFWHSRETTALYSPKSDVIIVCLYIYFIYITYIIYTYIYTHIHTFWHFIYIYTHMYIHTHIRILVWLLLILFLFLNEYWLPSALSIQFIQTPKMDFIHNTLFTFTPTSKHSANPIDYTIPIFFQTVIVLKYQSH